MPKQKRKGEQSAGLKFSALGSLFFDVLVAAS